MEQIKRIYLPAIPEDIVTDRFVNCAEQVALSGDYLQIKPCAPPFEGEINKEIIDSNSPAFINFFKQVRYQHIEAYEKYFAIPGIATNCLAELYRDPKTIFTPALQRFAKRAGLSLPPELTKDIFTNKSTSIPIAGQLIELPTEPNDPRMPEIVKLVTAELKKFIPLG
ncbi:MAG: hypothetical protein A4E52_02114 [Pelotomaculum sp. PtaB.Bin013]|nr:MAG: hypothetical protein A4E52_02114 [Pelotomaculum sp. PtaB.Bin013]